MKECPTCGRQCADADDYCPSDGSKLLRTEEGDARDPLFGRVLGGRFTIEERLGAGGFGRVYLAGQVSMDRRVALKVVDATRLAEDENGLLGRRFIREARTCSRLSHPNVVTALDFGQTDDGLLYYAMELVEGVSLKRLFADCGPLPPARAIGILAQVCNALSAAHAKGIVHRDLKPSNIMVAEVEGAADFVKVIDFGIAKVLADATTQLTGAGWAMGTPQYMSPEQVRGEEVTARGDLYSLGIVLYEALTGELPFGEGSASVVLMAQCQEEPGLDRPDVPGPLVPVLARLLDKRPERRHASAQELRRDLLAAREVLDSRAPDEDDEDATPARSVSLAARPAPERGTARTAVRGRWLLAAVGALGLAALALLALAWLRAAPGEEGPVASPARPVAATEPTRAPAPATPDAGARDAARPERAEPPQTTAPAPPEAPRRPAGETGRDRRRDVPAPVRPPTPAAPPRAPPPAPPPPEDDLLPFR